jgi:hypothetical protein
MTTLEDMHSEFYFDQQRRQSCRGCTPRGDALPLCLTFGVDPKAARMTSAYDTPCRIAKKMLVAASVAVTWISSAPSAGAVEHAVSHRSCLKATPCARLTLKLRWDQQHRRGPIADDSGETEAASSRTLREHHLGENQGGFSEIQC